MTDQKLSGYAEHCRACKGRGGDSDTINYDGGRSWVPCMMCGGTGRQEVMVLPTRGVK